MSSLRDATTTYLLGFKEKILLTIGEKKQRVLKPTLVM